MSSDEIQNILAGIKMLIQACHATERALENHTFLSDQGDLRQAHWLIKAAIERLNEEP